MKRVLTMPAAIVMLLLLAVPVSAQDACEDERTDFGAFACGQVVVTISADADATIDEIIERSAAGAEVLNESEAPDGSETNYILGVAEGSEWDTVLALRDDADVANADLVGVGELTPEETTIPDTAMEVAAPQSGVLTLLALVSVAFIGATTMLVRARQR